MAKKKMRILGEHSPQPVNPWGIKSQAVVQKKKPDEAPQVMTEQFRLGTRKTMERV